MLINRINMKPETKATNSTPVTITIPLIEFYPERAYRNSRLDYLTSQLTNDKQWSGNFSTSTANFLKGLLTTSSHF